jgi:hypothetical protein
MNCHARLDYGFQFFMGYPDSRASTHYNPDLQSRADGPLYGRDVRDLRGTGPLTPLGFANLATHQPEFRDCMADHFITYVLGDRATSDDRLAIQAAVADKGSVKAVMSVALERYAERWRAARELPRQDRTQLPQPPVVPHSNLTVAIDAPLRKQLDNHCVECHDAGRYSDERATEDTQPFDLGGRELSRTFVVRMVDRVAFGMMPKDAPLDTAAREELVDLLIDALWTDSQARNEAREYYLGQKRGLPAQQIDNSLSAIDGLAAARPAISWGALERGLWPDQSTITPGLLTLTSLEALDACRQASRDSGAKLDVCLARATSLQLLSRWPLHQP